MKLAMQMRAQTPRRGGPAEARNDQSSPNADDTSAVEIARHIGGMAAETEAMAAKA